MGAQTLHDVLPVHGLEGVEPHEGQEGVLRVGEVVHHVAPLQVRPRGGPLELKGVRRTLQGPEGVRFVDADELLERLGAEVGGDLFPHDLR